MHLLFPFLMVVVARIFDVSMGTMRVAFIARGRKVFAAGCGFIEVFIWICVVSQVLSGERHLAIYVAYATGYACGTLVGMFIEEHLAVGLALVQVITTRPAEALMQQLSAAGYGVTRQDAQGTRGPVQVLSILASRRRVNDLRAIVHAFDPDAFYAVSDVRQARDIPAAYATAGTGAGKSRMPV